MSSKRAIRRKQCEAKVRYATKEDAAEALLRLRACHKNARLVRPYPCTFCSGYHNGHPRRKRRTRRKEFAT